MPATKEVIDMVTERDVEIGRLSAGWDTDTDFDALPTRYVEVSEADAQNSELFTGDAEPDMFEQPEENFPVFKNALRYFQDRMPRTRAVRIDTERSYEGFGVEKALRELERRTNDLRAAVEQHAADKHGGHMQAMRAWDEVLGAVAAVTDLSKSASAHDAVAKMPQVPMTVPPAMKDAVKCWQDGENVVVSMRFCMPDGSRRIATMGSKPHVREEEIEAWAEENGYDPVTILGAVPALSSVATGRKLVRDTAQAALEAQTHPDVWEQEEDEPVLLIGLAVQSAPLAALMHLQQRAELGDESAMKELELMYTAALTSQGMGTVAPVLKEANRRLAVGRGRANESMADRYAKLAAFV